MLFLQQKNTESEDYDQAPLQMCIRDRCEVKEKFNKYDVSKLVENIAITDSNKNFRVLLKSYEMINGKDDTYNIIKDFIELLSDRNIFAHVREEKNGVGQYQFKKLNNDEYLVLSDEKCIELRTSIIKSVSYTHLDVYKRQGELLALTPADFNFEKTTLRINKSYQRLEGKDVITDPKTPKSNRTIVMPDFLAIEM